MSRSGYSDECEDQQILDLAHRMCSVYKHSEHANLISYQFNQATLLHFVDAILKTGNMA